LIEFNEELYIQNNLSDTASALQREYYVGIERRRVNHKNEIRRANFIQATNMSAIEQGYHVETPIPVGLNFELRPYQKQSLAFMLPNERAR
jgi:hypothetical protein